MSLLVPSSTHILTKDKLNLECLLQFLNKPLEKPVKQLYHSLLEPTEGHWLNAQHNNSTLIERRWVDLYLLPFVTCDTLGSTVNGVHAGTV